MWRASVQAYAQFKHRLACSSISRDPSARIAITELRSALNTVSTPGWPLDAGRCAAPIGDAHLFPVLQSFAVPAISYHPELWRLHNSEPWHQPVRHHYVSIAAAQGHDGRKPG